MTSVGATQFTARPITASSPEVASVGFHSGGGSSWLFPRPAYQATAVGEYLSGNHTLPAQLHYNPGGRFTPDVAGRSVFPSLYVNLMLVQLSA